MITQARISEDIKPAGLDWITALRAPAIKALLEGGALKMSLFDDSDMAGITSPEFPGERAVMPDPPIGFRSTGLPAVLGQMPRPEVQI